MIKHWVDQSSPKATWSSLIEALSCHVIGRGDIAIAIQSRYKVIKEEKKNFSEYICNLNFLIFSVIS